MNTILLFLGIALIALFVLGRLLRRSKPESWVEPTQCPHCGWQGKVSRYAGRCPACNEPLGDRLSRPER